jgi:uncharacterized membrane protein YgdD (TMEM256/DUF423 family)
LTASPSPRFPRHALALGAAFALLAVAIGAFAAHGLKAVLGSYQLGLFETAARYQMYHAFGLMIVGLVSLQTRFPERLLKSAALAFALGILLFSGSLYLLALTGIRWLGAITPLGGTAFIAGWLLLCVAALKKPSAGD